MQDSKLLGRRRLSDESLRLLPFFSILKAHVKYVSLTIFGLNVLLGNVCLMGTAEAQSMPMPMSAMHQEMHGMTHCSHVGSAIEATCSAHQLQETATLRSSTDHYGIQAASVYPFSLITQALLVVGDSSKIRRVEYPPPLTSNSTVVLNQ